MQGMMLMRRLAMLRATHQEKMHHWSPLMQHRLGLRRQTQTQVLLAMLLCQTSLLTPQLETCLTQSMQQMALLAGS